MVKALLFLIACLSAVACAVDVLGVPPEEVSRYDGSQDEAFKCDDGKTILSLKAINDNFCDCTDGSDEPGTNACVGSHTFYCANKGFQPKNIPSAFVNDKICDCCDGSDEYATGACTDTCEALAKVELVKEKEMLTIQYQGYMRKLIMIEEAKKVRETMINRAQELASLIEASEPVKAQHAATVLEKQNLVDIENAQLLVEKEKKEAEEAMNQTAPTATTASDVEKSDVAEDVHPDDRDMENYGEDYHSLTEATTGEEDEEFEDEAGDNYDPDLDENERQMRRAMEQSRAQHHHHDHHGHHGGGHYHPAEQKPQTQAQKDLKDAETAKEQYESQVEQWGRNKEKIEGDLKLDFGLEDEFLPLREKCFNTNADKFEYSLCLYKGVDQTPGSISLGQNMAFTGTPDKYSKIEFTGGRHCWDGPDRMISIQVLCGAENAITNVNEPQKCVYSMDFYTPAACTAPSKERMAALGINVEDITVTEKVEVEEEGVMSDDMEDFHHIVHEEL